MYKEMFYGAVLLHVIRHLFFNKMPINLISLTNQIEVGSHFQREEEGGVANDIPISNFLPFTLGCLKTEVSGAT